MTGTSRTFTKLLAVPVVALATLSGGAATAVSGPAAPSGAAPAPATRTPAPVALPVGFRPEGLTSGPGDTYYVGSLADGRIRTGDLSRGTGRDLLAGVEGRSLRGLLRDPRSGLLWAVGQDGDTGIVLVVEARTGRLLHRIEVPGASFLNDLVITGRDVWVTDSYVDALTRIRLDRHGHPVGAPSTLPLTGDWPTPEGLRGNGIRALPDGSLVLDNSTAGGLWRVDPATGVTRAIPVSGGPVPSGLSSGDGLVLAGRTLYVVRGSGAPAEITQLSLRRDAAGWSARWVRELTSPDLDYPATATLVGHRLWTVNARFAEADPTTATYSIAALPV
jgi:streptogramin lyase